jgi:hypothetical protein
MKTLFARLVSADRNELTYWLGLLMLFVGLAVSVSAETALVIVGAAIAGESVITSYLAAWIGARK